MPFLHPSTKPLNAGVTGTAPVLLTGVTWNAYVSTDGITFHKQNATPMPIAGFVNFNTYNAGGAAPPPTDTARISPPVQPLGFGFVGPAGTFPAGTYYVSATYVTALGETTLGAVVGSVVMDGAHALAVTVGTPDTSFVDVELHVPRLEDWHITRYAIQTSSAVSQPYCDIYIDSVSLVNILDTTTLGARNSANSDLYLRPGQVIIARWSFIDANATATLSVFGEKTS